MAFMFQVQMTERLGEFRMEVGRSMGMGSHNPRG